MSTDISKNPAIRLPMKQLLKGQASLRAVNIKGASNKNVLDNQTCALVLAVQINHVTATASVATFYHKDANPVPCFQATIPSATATGSIDGFSASTSEGHAGWLPIFLPPGSSITFTGDANATVTVYILEWQIE
jgi:hypothetical protein